MSTTSTSRDDSPLVPILAGAVCLLTSSVATTCRPADAQAVRERADASNSTPTRPPPDVEPCELARPEMVCIPGGWFVRGTDDGPRNARPEQRIWVQTFYLDRHEVTVREYRACEKADDCPEDRAQYSDFDRPMQPKNGVSWHDAKQYCRAHDKRLPTEAEWEKAARTTDGRSYPWGETRATCERAVVRNGEGKSCGIEKATGKHEVGRTFAVGSRPPNPYGLYDMAGNSWEWVRDWASESWSECGEPCSEFNPEGPCDGRTPCPEHHRRVVRGGSWYWPGRRARTFYRRFHFPDNEPYHHFGFRCASSEGRKRGDIRDSER